MAGVVAGVGIQCANALLSDKAGIILAALLSEDTSALLLAGVVAGVGVEKVKTLLSGYARGCIATTLACIIVCPNLYNRSAWFCNK